MITNTLMMNIFWPKELVEVALIVILYIQNVQRVMVFWMILIMFSDEQNEYIKLK